MDLEMAAMQLVGSAGESKSLCFEALAAAKKGDFDGADAKIAEARKVFLQAHEVQTELICAEADGEDVKMGVLMVHAQDHLMTTMTLREVALDMLELYKKVN